MSKPVTPEVIEAKVEALEKANEEFREVTRQNMADIIIKLDDIALKVAILNSRSVCTDPGSCQRLETASQLYEKRITSIEQEIILNKKFLSAGKVMFMGACGMVAWLVTVCVEWFKK